MTDLLSIGIEKMKPSSDPMPVVLVGGGAVLVTEQLEVASEVLRPEHADVANAIGAAIAQIGGEAEQLVAYDEVGREEAIARVTAEATETAVAAGAERSTIRVADLEEIAMSYMASPTTSVRVKVVGDIAGLGQRSGAQ